MSGATAFGALMFEIADLAPLAREPSATELAPYAHQFAGDMTCADNAAATGSDPGTPTDHYPLGPARADRAMDRSACDDLYASASRAQCDVDANNGTQR